MTNPTKTRRRCTAQQKQGVVEERLTEGLRSIAVALLLGVGNSCQAKWVRQTRLDRGDSNPPEQGQRTSDGRAKPARLRKTIRKLRGETIVSSWRHYILPKSTTTERRQLINQLSDRVSVARLCKHWAWPAAASTPGGSANTAQTYGLDEDTDDAL